VRCCRTGSRKPAVIDSGQPILSSPARASPINPMSRIPWRSSSNAARVRARSGFAVPRGHDTFRTAVEQSRADGMLESGNHF